MANDQSSECLPGDAPPPYVVANPAVIANEKTPGDSTTVPSAMPPRSAADLKWRQVAYAKEAMYRAAKEPMDEKMHVRLATDDHLIALRWCMISSPQALDYQSERKGWGVVELPPNGPPGKSEMDRQLMLAAMTLDAWATYKHMRIVVTMVDNQTVRTAVLRK